MLRAKLWASALGPVLLLGCATTSAPTSAQPAPVVAPDEQPSNVQHPDVPSRKRGVIVPSDVSTPAGETPAPAVSQTASPGAAPATGTGN